ncbi:MAG: gamma-glutamyl-gamma-aminobutyrate hydrolase family protein [Gammaproteobacteria bacterium]|nr:gamma-glutamyl-gamma-aminobutyrate hydrolase family protein [Gammaproteobacteria bacterium]NNF60638.1 C26 family cysteine hydrolase domain-containing family [Gammaproteobacteria bacterium]NNM20718.1 C26 family cysteine hydrolase domain-containing family [Gammaproteobacteria bacterium]
MRRLLVFQHVPFEILGIFHPMLKDRGFRIRYVNFARTPHAQPDVEKYNGLIVLGGPMNVDQHEQFPHLEFEIRAIRRAMDCGIPVLGICLGAQLIARASGATVTPAPAPEIGWYEVAPTAEAAADPVLAPLTMERQIFQWHADTAELPADAVHLASSPLCANQAFRLGDRTYGFQFHLEVDQPLIERWLEVPVHREELADLRGLIDPDEIRRATVQHIADSHELGQAIFGRFIELFGLPARRRLLRHR